MAVSQPNLNGTGDRKRRAHKKSRRGCNGCKLRRIKCDERLPRCDRCDSFGVDCTYNSKSFELKFAGESSFTVTTAQPPALGTTTTALAITRGRSSSESSSSSNDTDRTLKGLSLASPGLEVLSRFQSRTVLTVGTKTASTIYRDVILKLAAVHPFLAHIVSALTLMHDRHLTGSASIEEAAALHWYRGTTLFKNALIKPVESSERDALWASAALLSCISFASIEARVPEEAWPLKAACSNDLEWLKMSDGKKAVWQIADPTRPDSCFRSIGGHPDLYRPLTFDHEDTASVTRNFCELYDLGPSSNRTENPYYNAAMLLARLFSVRCDGDTLLEFLMFMSQLNPKLKQLLEQKEPKALLLLACWYAKIYKYQWWIYRRGLLEGQAICIYLDRYYSHAMSIQNLLQYPKMAFGLAFPSLGDEIPSLALEQKPIAVTI